MAAREYVGAGGMRLHLDEPLSPEMAAQVDKGELRLAEDGEPLLDQDREVQPQVVQHGADAPAATRVGRNVPSAPEKPDVDAHAGAWATYAVRLGLLATKASTMSLQQLIEWVESVEDASTAAVGDSGEGVEGPEHASVDGRPSDARGEEKPVVADEDNPAEPPAEGDASPTETKRPNANSRVDEWRTYAVSLGMPQDEADDATKAELQDWVKVAESDEGSGD